MGSRVSLWSIVRAAVGVAVLVCFGSLEGAVAASAFAASGPVAGSPANWPLHEAADTLLGFGETYVAASGAPSVHRGIDLAARPGDAIVAPVPGEVLFAGSVPSAGGGTHLAVTIDAGGAGILSLTPLERAFVAEGDIVGVGSRVGALAAAGDASGGSAHLHLSLRLAGEYVDPTALLIPPSSATEVPPDSGSHAAVQGDSGAGAGAGAGVEVAPTETELGHKPVEVATRPEYSRSAGTRSSAPVTPVSRPVGEALQRNSMASMPVILAEIAHRGALSASGLGVQHITRTRSTRGETSRSSISTRETFKLLRPSIPAVPALFLLLAAWLKRRSHSLPAVSHLRE